MPVFYCHARPFREGIVGVPLYGDSRMFHVWVPIVEETTRLGLLWMQYAEKGYVGAASNDGDERGRRIHNDFNRIAIQNRVEERYAQMPNRSMTKNKRH